MARFYEHLAIEHPDLNIFNLQPAIVETDLYKKGELALGDTLDTSKTICDPMIWCGDLMLYSSTPRTFHSLAGKPRG